jgi:hypothetical protein
VITLTPDERAALLAALATLDDEALASAVFVGGSVGDSCPIVGRVLLRLCEDIVARSTERAAGGDAVAADNALNYSRAAEDIKRRLSAIGGAA